jgi:hypothetical protein
MGKLQFYVSKIVKNSKFNENKEDSTEEINTNKSKYIEDPQVKDYLEKIVRKNKLKQLLNYY